VLLFVGITKGKYNAIRLILTSCQAINFAIEVQPHFFPARKLKPYRLVNFYGRELMFEKNYYFCGSNKSKDGKEFSDSGVAC
jgi:hypothetical protein